MDLVPVGKQVKYSEAWHRRQRDRRGSGWNERDRQNFKRWEAEERALRWTVVEHVQSGTEHNPAILGPIYKLERVEMIGDDTITHTSYAVPYIYEEA